MTPLTDQVILEKAIYKALDAGWLPSPTGYVDFVIFDDLTVQFSTIEGKIIDYRLKELIFNHEFAKALFGNSKRTVGKIREWINEPYTLMKQPNWQYHLQQLVINENPIQYLGENI